MIDHLRLALYFKESRLVRDSTDKAYLIGKPCDYGFKMGARHVEFDEMGRPMVADLYAPYDLSLIHISEPTRPY